MSSLCQINIAIYQLWLKPHAFYSYFLDTKARSRGSLCQFPPFRYLTIFPQQLTTPCGPLTTGENFDAVTAVTDSFKMADAFAGDRTGGAVAQTNARTVDISVRQGRVWVYRLQRMYGSDWRVVPRAKSAIVDARDAAVTARRWCSISLVKPNKDSVTT